MKRLFTVFLIAIFSISTAFAQLDIVPNAGSSPRDFSIYQILPKKKGKIPQNKSVLPTEFVYDLADSIAVFSPNSALNGNAGIVYLNNEFWVSKWATDSIFVLDNTGSVIDSFVVNGVSGTRSFTTDGVSIFAGNATNDIYAINPITRTLDSTIVATGSVGARVCAYDPTADNGNGGFWIANFTSDIQLVDRSGAILTTITQATHGVPSMYGGFVDTSTAGGPYLAVYHQGVNRQAIIEFINIPSGTNSGIFYDTHFDLLSTQQPTAVDDPIAGGLFLSDQYSPGKLTMMGVLQGANDILFGFEYETPTCVNPVNLTANPVGNGIEIEWTSTASTSNIIYGPPGFTRGMGTKISNITSPYVLSGLPFNENYEFRIEDSCGVGNNSYWSMPATFSTPSTLPFLEDFETFDPGIDRNPWPNGWSNIVTSAPNWESEDSEGANENSLSTGPFYDNTTPSTAGGMYVYLETTGGSQGDNDTLISAPIFIDNVVSNLSISFWYHMYGSSMGDLELYVEEVGAGSTLLTNISGQQQTAGNDPWMQFDTTLSGYAGKVIRLKFVGIRGSSFYSDMAIDDIRVDPIFSINASAVSVDQPMSFCAGSNDVYATIKNSGTSFLDSIDVNFSVNGVAQPTFVYKGGLAADEDTSILIGSYSSFVAGANEVEVFTSNPNGQTDPFAADDTVRTTLTSAANPIAIESFNPTLDSITIFVQGSPGGIDYEYGPSGFTPGLGLGTVGTSSTDTFGISGLNQNTVYDIYVRTNCGGGDVSSGIGPHTFNTAYGLPFNQDFEQFAVGITSNPWPEGWSTTATSNPSWESEDSEGANENSLSTGPFYDNTNFGNAGGMYLFLETTGGSQGDRDTLSSPPIVIDTSISAFELEFWYHMYGQSMGDLEVYIESNGIFQLLTTISGQQQADGGDPWLSYSTILNSYSGQTVRFHFVGIRGSNFYSDMSIDDISVRPLLPINAGVVDIQSFTGILCPGGYAPVVGVRNLGTTTIDSVNIVWDINGTVDSLIYRGQILTGDTTYVTLPSINFVSGQNYNVKIYTGIVNGNSDDFSEDDTLNLGSNLRVGLSGTYTLDPSQAASSSNFTNFDDLLDSLQQFGVCGNVEVNVSPGVYNTSVYLQNIPGLNASNTLTIDGGDSSQTIISHDGSVNYATVTFDATSHLTLRNLTIQTTASSGSGAVLLANGSNYNVIENSVIRGEHNATSTTATALLFSSSTTSRSTGADANYNLFRNNRIIGGYYGVYFYGGSTGLNVNNKVYNNEIDSSYLYGIYTYYQDSVEVIGNRIHMLNSSSTGADGAYMYYSNNTIFNQNYIWARDYGVYFNNLNTYAPINRKFEVTNNMVYSEGDYGMYFYYVDSVDIFHNSIHVEGTSSPALQINESSTTTISDYDIRNNIFSSVNSIAFETNSSNSFYDEFNYNIFYSTGSALITIDGVSYSDLSSYQQQNSWNLNSFEGNPEFVSNTDLRIIGLLPNDNGDVNVGLNVDINGNVRPSPNGFGVDIGAFEFDPPNLDASLSSMSQPQLPVCAGTYPLSVIVANLGMDTLETLDLYWEFNGVLDSLSYTTSLATGDTVEVNLDTITLSSGVAYDLIIYSASPNSGADERTINDTLEFISLRTALSGSYTVDASQAASSTNYTDLSSLISDLNAYGVCGQTTVNIANGVYNTSVYLNNIEGLSQTNQLIFDGGDSSQTIISHDGSVNYATFTFDASSHVTLRNLTIQTTASSGSGAVLLANGSNYNVIENSVIRGEHNATSNTATALLFSSSTTSRSTGADANYNLFRNNRIIGGYYGVYFYGGSTGLNVNNKVYNNEIDSSYLYGIYTYYQDSVEVIGNRIHMLNSSSTGADGAYMYYSNNTIFNQNYIWARDYGVYFYNLNTYAPINRRFEVVNNMVYSEGDYGIYFYYVDSVNLWHNSVHVEGTSSPALQINATTSTQITSYDVRNNIFSSLNTMAMETNEPDTIFDKLDYNVYYAPNDDAFDIDGTTYATLVDYQNANSVLNINSLEGDPQFLSNIDLHIVGSFVNDWGDPSVNVLEDIDGDVRPLPGATGVDIGADEYNPPPCPPLNNLAATNIKLDSATIYWDGSNIQNQQYIYELVACDSTQGTGIIDTVYSDSVMVGGLVENTCYDLYVLEVCGRGDTSMWTGPISFTTAALGTISGIDTICLGDTVELSTSGTCPYFQWQLLDANNNWVDITGADSSSIMVTPMDTTTYRVIECDTTPSSNVFTVIPLNVVAPTVSSSQPTVACGTSGTDTLVASSITAGAEFIWYDDSLRTNEVHRGDTLLYTETATFPSVVDTFYVTSATGATNETAGPLDNSIGNSANFNNVWVQELYFEVFRPTTLKSVLLYPSGSGVIEVELRDASGTVLQSKLISVSNTSGERVNLDFQLPIGTYEIGGGTNSTVGLQRNSTGASYPYTSSNGSVSITGNSFGTSYYYYFYDWELGGGCESEAVMAIATIDCLVGLEDDLTAVNSFEIYPNPSSGLFTMSFTTVKAEQLNLSVRDVAGKLILSRDIHVNGSYRDDIDLSHLSKGIYYLHLQNESGVKVEKLIIQ